MFVFSHSAAIFHEVQSQKIRALSVLMDDNAHVNVLYD